jgi:hypothetical protein
MINIPLTENEIRSLIQALETECNLYNKEFSKSSLSIIREVSHRVIEQNNSLINKLETYIGSGVPF